MKPPHRNPGQPIRALAIVALLLAPPAVALDAKLDMPKSALREAVSAGSLTFAATRQTKTPDPQDVVAAARADYRNLLGILYRAGYYGGTISILLDGREAAEMSPFEVPASIDKVVVRVVAGPLFRFGRAEVGPLAPGTDLPATFRAGEPAASSAIGDAVEAAVEGWRDASYAKAAPGARSIVADHPKSILDAAVTIEPGRTFVFGQLTISGNGAVRADRIREIAGLRTGHAFSPRELEAVARRLRATGAFSSVALAEAENPPGEALDIAVALVEEKPRRIGFGAEIASLEGLTVSGYWLHRNILGGAERLRFDGKISGIASETGGVDYALSAQFTRPGTFSAENTLNAKVELESLDEPGFRQRLGAVEVGLSRDLSDRLEVTAALRYEFSEVTDDLGTRNFSLVELPMTGQLDARDAPLDPRKGYFLRLEATPFASVTGGEAGGRVYGDARAYYSPGDGPVTLAGRFQAGSAIGASIAGTPPEFLFFSGGSGTVRGQPYQSLGVDPGGGSFVGGRSFLGASGELRVRTGRKLSLVGFADFGMIGPDPVPGADGETHSGAGIGLRYDTRIGPVRLDVAAPVGGDTGEGVQVYVGIGQSF